MTRVCWNRFAWLARCLGACACVMQTGAIPYSISLLRQATHMCADSILKERGKDDGVEWFLKKKQGMENIYQY